MTVRWTAAALSLLLGAPLWAQSPPPVPNPVPAAGEEEPASSAPDPAATSNTPEPTKPSGSEGERVVVVTATRTPTEAAKTTASVTVISREEIEAAQYRTVAEAIRHVPGISIAANGAPGQTAGVFIRGTKTSDTQVLIDGRRLPFNLAGSYNLENLTLDNVERIEVARGPLSSVQGGSASGGVINIITRGGKGLQKPEHEVSFEAGSYATFREIAASRGAFGPFDYSVQASRFDSEFQRRNNETRLTNLSAKPGVQITRDLYADLLFTYNLADVGTPGSITTNDPDDNLLRETWLISPRAEWEITDWWTQSVIYSHAQQRQAATGFTGFFNPSNRIQIDTDQVELQSTFRPFESWTLTAGSSVIDTRYYRVNDTAGGVVDLENNITTSALFLGSQWDILENWRLDNSLRFDHYSDFGNPVTWRVGTVYRVPTLATRIHAAYGTAFSPPNPQDIAPVFFGNPNVGPERTQGYEAGLEQPFWGERIRVGATYFRNRSSNQIIFNLSTFKLENIGVATSEGWEITLTARPHETLDLTFNYTNTNALNRSAGTRLVRRPMHELDASATWRPLASIRLNAGLTWVADREDFVGFSQGAIEDYFVCRLAAAWDVHEHVQVFGRVENLTGEEYAEVFGFPALDTALYAGVKVSY